MLLSALGGALFVSVNVYRWGPFVKWGRPSRCIVTAASLALLGTASPLYRNAGADDYIYYLVSTFVAYLIVCAGIFALLGLYASRKEKKKRAATRVPMHHTHSTRTETASVSTVEPMDELWAEVLDEFERGEYSRGLWAQCFSECDGEQSRAKATYLRKRVAQLQQERGWSGASSLKPQSLNQTRFDQQQRDRIEPYLSKPIHVHSYMSKYRVTENELRQAIVKGKIRSELIDDSLWIEDRSFKKR